MRLSTVEIASQLIRRVRAGEIPPIWCEAGQFSIQAGTGRVPLLRADARRLARSGSLDVNRRQAKRDPEFIGGQLVINGRLMEMW